MYKRVLFQKFVLLLNGNQFQNKKKYVAIVN